MKLTARNTTQIKKIARRWVFISLHKYSNDKILKIPKVVNKFVCMIIQLFAKVVQQYCFKLFGENRSTLAFQNAAL